MNTVDEYFSEGADEFGAQEYQVPPAETDPRRLLVILLDTSGSMGPPPGEQAHRVYPIDELNDALDLYLDDMEQSQFAYNGEVAIGEFYERVEGNPVIRWLPLGESPSEPNTPFYFAREVHPLAVAERLTAGGKTPMGDAISYGLDVAAARREKLREQNIVVTPRPVVVVLTDGAPSDSIDEAAAQLHQMEASNEVVLWIGYTNDAQPGAMRVLADKGNLIPLGDAPIASFMALLEASAQVGGRTAAEIYDGMRSALGLPSHG